MGRMLSLRADKKDDDNFRHGYQKNIGDDLGDVTVDNTYKFGQYCPMFFNREGATINIDGMYRGSSAFIIANGPSLKNFDLTKLKQPGIVTLGVNNGPAYFRPDIWTCVDDPSRFIYSIWKDPKIMKIVPQAHFEKHLWMSGNIDGTDLWRESPDKVGDCPNVVGIRRNEKFAAHRFLSENTFNWGNHKKFGGNRSVFLIALRTLYMLGIRRIYILGMDFTMNKDSKYAFNEGRSNGALKCNNNTYNFLKDIAFPQLIPYFKDAGLEVYNCNPESAVKAFPIVDYDEAIKECTYCLGDLSKEKSNGMYLPMAKKKEHGTYEACVNATNRENDEDSKDYNK